MPDGSITFSTALDNKELEKELGRVKRKIQSLEKDIALSETKKMPLVEQSKQLSVALDEAKAKLFEMQNAAKGTYSASEISEQKEQVRGLQAEYNKVQGAVERYNQKIRDATTELELAKESAGGIEKEIAAANSTTSIAADNAARMADAVKRAGNHMKNFTDRVKRLASRVFIFTLITSALRNMRTWLGNVIKTNDEAVSAIANLKGALLTLAQPIVNVIIPAFTAFINILTKVITAIAKFVSFLFGTTIEESKKAAENLNKEITAIEGVGAAASEAAGEIAAFDEINMLAAENASGAGGAIAGGIGTAFDFDTTSSLFNLPDWLKNLAVDLQMKIKDLKVDWEKGNLAKNQDAWIIGLSAFLGAVLGGMFGGLKGAVLGLLLGAAIGIIGCTILDKTDNPSKYKKIATVALEGIIGGVLGAKFGGLSGAILGILLGLSVGFISLQFQDGDFDSWGAIDTFNVAMTAIFGAVLGGMFGGLHGAILGMLLGASISIISANFLNKLRNAGIEKVKWNAALYALLGGIIGAQFGGLTGAAIGVVLGLSISLISAQFDDSIDAGTKKKISGIFSAVLTAIIGAIIGFALGGGVFGGIVGGAVGLTLGLAIHWGDITYDSIPDPTRNRGSFTSGGSISPSLSSYSIPALAAGAVIPPNRQFMAVLGDQTSGNNIEAPEDLIRKIVREEAGGSNTELLQAILEAIRAGQVIKVNETVLGRTSAKAINKLTQSYGKPVLLL